MNWTENCSVVEWVMINELHWQCTQYLGQHMKSWHLKGKFTRTWKKFSHYLLLPLPKGGHLKFCFSRLLTDRVAASPKLVGLVFKKTYWVKYKTALYSSSGVIQVSGSPEIPNWFEKMLYICSLSVFFFLIPFKTSPHLLQLFQRELLDCFVVNLRKCFSLALTFHPHGAEWLNFHFCLN